MAEGAAVQEGTSSSSAGRNSTEFIERVRAELNPELQVLRPLGRSLVAEVFLAREPALKRLVAVKVLSPHLVDDASAVRRFEREAQSAARIAHPNVVTVYRVGRLSRGLPFLVMRFIKGRSLGDLVRADGPLEYHDACEILGTVASAVAAGHRSNVVHRDIKPSNVLVETGTGRVVVVDFGIAAILATGEEEPDRITTVGHIVGDPQYMSPERLHGEMADEASDVYNLGLLGYEVLTGRGPFVADSSRGWTEAHLGEEPPPISSLQIIVDKGLEDLLLRCLAKNPAHRPNAADFEESVRSFCRVESVPLPSPPSLIEDKGAPQAVTPPLESRPARPPAPRQLLGPTDHKFRLDVLGKLDLANEDGGRVLSIVAQPRRVALLTYLAAGAGEELKRRERIVSVFWPDLEEDKGRHALRQALYVLRGSLGSEILTSRGDDQVGLARDVLWSDATAFEQAIAEDRPDIAMELYRGPLLPGFYLTDVIEFEHWLDHERLRLERLATEAAWRLAAEREASGDGGEALRWGRRAADLAPFDESILRRLLELHLRLGDRGGALNAFETFARRLSEELEAEPMEQTLALVARVRGG